MRLSENQAFSGTKCGNFSELEVNPVGYYLAIPEVQAIAWRRAVRRRLGMPVSSSRQTDRRPVLQLTRNRTRKIKKRIFAMLAAIPATPKKPRAPAINAITRKTSA